MPNLKNFLTSVSRWVEAHWKYVMTTLVCVIVLQQCSIMQLQRQIDSITTFKNQPVSSSAVSSSAVSSAQSTDVDCSAVATADSSADAESESFSSDECNELGDAEQGTHSNLPAVLVVLTVAALVGIGFYMKVRGVYPIGLWVGGKLRQTSNGELLISLSIKNRSSKEIEAAEPIVSFYLPGGQRKFRAGIAEMPLTLQPGTSFYTEVNLSKLIGANLELMQAKAIGISAQCNGKRHGSLPNPVRISPK